MTYKFVPIITTLMEYWGVHEGSIGILQSANSWAAVFLLIPIGYLQKHWKPRFSGGLAMAFMVVGNLLGLFAPSFVFLIIGRIFEGLGAITISTLTQNLVLNSFGERRATAVGILTCGQYVGQACNIFLANAFVASLGWQVVYGYMCAFELIFGIVWLIFANDSVTIVGLRDPAAPAPAIAAPLKSQTKSASGLRTLLRSKFLWLLIISASFYGPCISQFSNYIPTYLSTRGMPLTQANLLFNISVVFGAISMASTGFVSDKLGTKRKIAVFAYLGTVALYFLLMNMPLGMTPVFMVLVGLVSRTLNVLAVSSMPQLLDNPADLPLANSMLATMNQVSNIVGHIFLGYLIEFTGYHCTIYVIMGLMVLACVLWLLNKRVK